MPRALFAYRQVSYARRNRNQLAAVVRAVQGGTQAPSRSLFSSLDRKALRQSEARYRQLYDTMPNGDLMAFCRDTSERKRSEERLHQAQRLEAWPNGCCPMAGGSSCSASRST